MVEKISIISFLSPKNGTAAMFCWTMMRIGEMMAKLVSTSFLMPSIVMFATTILLPKPLNCVICRESGLPQLL